MSSILCTYHPLVYKITSNTLVFQTMDDDKQLCNTGSSCSDSDTMEGIYAEASNDTNFESADTEVNDNLLDYETEVSNSSPPSTKLYGPENIISHQVLACGDSFISDFHRNLDGRTVKSVITNYGKCTHVSGDVSTYDDVPCTSAQARARELSLSNIDDVSFNRDITRNSVFGGIRQNSVDGVIINDINIGVDHSRVGKPVQHSDECCGRAPPHGIFPSYSPHNGISSDTNTVISSNESSCAPGKI